MLNFSNSRYALGTAESAKNAENTLIFLAPLALFAVKRELVRSVS